MTRPLDPGIIQKIQSTYAETKSFSKTAAQLGISPGAARNYVKKSMLDGNKPSAMLQPIPATSTPPANANISTYGQLGLVIPKGVPLDQETGTPGLKHWFGRLAEEWINELIDESGKRIYQEMAWNDPTISAILFAIEMLVRQAPWAVDPVDESDAELERAEFLESTMHDMYVPWTEFLSEALSFCHQGFALHELVFKSRRGAKGTPPSDHDDGKVGFHKFAPRSQESVYRWIIDDKGELLGIVQWAPPLYEQKTIGYDKLLHFKTRGYRHSPEGVSLIRGAFRPWSFKKRIEEYEAIGIERDLCGLPLIQIHDEIMAAAEGTGDDAIRAQALVNSMKTLGTRVKQDEQGCIVFPLGYDQDGNELYKFSLISAAGSRTINTSEVLQRLSQQIATVVLADFILLGHEKVGSFSLASSKTDVFALAIAGIMDCICEGLNRKAVPLLFEANGETGPYPQITHGDIETPDLAALGGYVSSLTGANIDLTDEPTQRYLRRAGNLPTEIEG